MKKTILKAMLFFAFLMIGLQSASAQYVASDDATILLTTEIQEAQDQTANVPASTKETVGVYLEDKISLFSFVKEAIEGGTTVENAILTGANRFNLTVNSFSIGATTGKNPYVAPLHQELMDLLAQ